MLLQRYRFDYSVRVTHSLEKQFDRLKAGAATKHQRRQWLRWAAQNFDNPDHRNLFNKSGLVYPDALAVVPQQELFANLSDVVRDKNTQRKDQYKKNALVSEDFHDQGKRLINSFEKQFAKAFLLRDKGIKEEELAVFQHRAELRILNRAREASANQALNIRQVTVRLSQTLLAHAEYLALPPRYCGPNAPCPIALCQMALENGTLIPSRLPLAVATAWEAYDIACKTFQPPITPRGANTCFLPGTIRERWLILGMKKGGIEPGFLMVNILNPDGTINLTLARDLWELLGGSEHFRHVDDIRSIEALLTLIDEVREERLLGVYLAGLQVDLTHGFLHVKRIKNGLPSTQPLGGKELRALRQLKRQNESIDSHNRSYVFISQRGTPISDRLVREIVALAGKAADFDMPIHPHMLRHSTGFYLANKANDTRSIQQYMGHKNIQNTVRYTELSPDRFKDFWSD